MKCMSLINVREERGNKKRELQSLLSEFKQTNSQHSD